MLNSVTDGLDNVPLIAFVALAALVIWGAVWLTITLFYYLRATPLQRERIRHSWRVSRRWRRLAPNVGLARVDENSKGAKDFNGKAKAPTVVVPKIKVFAEPYGIRVHAKSIPKVGIEEYEKASNWLADAWGCERVDVKRVSPGTIELKGLVGHPLDEHKPWPFPSVGDWVLPLGHNPWNRDISIPLDDLSGIKVAGMPGYGKSMLMFGWYASLVTSDAVQPVIFDGKTSDPRYGVWGPFADRAMFIVGDNPETANQRLTELVTMLKDRPAHLVEERGTPKFWKHGPTSTIPLVPVILDECHNYIDSTGLKGKEKDLIEANQRHMRTITKEGRELGFLPIVGTQKQTGDAIPTAVRDNLEVGISFATFTLDAAEAALGGGIRKVDEDEQPLALTDKSRYKGVCVVTGVPKLGGRYDQIRVGELDEDDLAQLVQEHAHLRRDLIPRPAPVLRDAGTAVPMQKTQAVNRKRKSA